MLPVPPVDNEDANALARAETAWYDDTTGGRRGGRKRDEREVLGVLEVHEVLALFESPFKRAKRA